MENLIILSKYGKIVIRKNNKNELIFQFPESINGRKLKFIKRKYKKTINFFKYNVN